MRVVDDTEQKFSDLEKLYDSIVKHSNSVVLRWNLKDGIIFINEYGRKYFGYREGELTGQPVSVLIPEKETTGRDLSYLAENIAARPGRYRFSENENIRKNGRRVWVKWSNNAVLGDEGEIKEIISIGNDITSCKKSQERYRKLCSAAAVGIFVTCVEGKILYANEVFLNLLGFRSLHELQKQNVLEFYKTPETREKIKRKILRFGSVRNYEMEVVNRYGEVKKVLVGGTLIGEGEVVGTIQDITAVKKVQEKIEYSERRLRAVLDVMPVGVFITDSKGVIVDSNPAGRKIWGGKAPKVRLEEYAEYKAWWPDGRKVADEEWGLYRAFRKGEVTGPEEMNIEAFDGTRKIINNYAVPIKNDKGKIVGAVAVVGDITALKQAEDELKRREKSYRMLAENSLEVVARLDEQIRYVYINKYGEKMYGLSREKIIGKKIEELGLPDNVVKSLKKNTEEVFRTGRERTVEFEIDSPTSGHMWFSAIAIPELDEKDQVKTLLTLSRDITAEKEKEKQLRESQEEYKALAESIPEIIVRFDTEFKYLYINSYGEKVYGISKENIIGKRLGELGFSKNIKSFLEEKGREIIRNKSQLTYEFETITPGVGKRSFSTIAFPEYDDKGNVKSILSITRDITAIKEAERVLIRDKKELEKLVNKRTEELINIRLEIEHSRRLADMGALAATVAHELRNPLNAIRLASYNIKKKAQVPEIEKQLNTIQIKLEDGNKIINDLLNFSKLRKPEFTKIKLKDILDESIKIAVEYHKGKSVKIRKDYANIESVEIKADGLQIEEAIINILNNSFEAVKSDAGNIKISGKIRKNIICIYIADNGEGMDEETLKNVGRYFFTTKPRGTGLGIAVVEQIINFHNGRFKIESEKGKGTIVKIYLRKNPHVSRLESLL